MPRVSVLIPVYNTKEDYFRESLESILNQTYQDIEIIIVDDGSKNDIEPIIESYKDSRIKFYRNEKNCGVAYTRNRLMDLAEGEYVAYQDSDDISLPQRLEKQVKFLDENPEISVVGGWLKLFPRYKLFKKVPSPGVLDFLAGCAVQQPVALMRLADFKKYKLRYNEEYLTSEDYDLWCRAVLYLRFANLQEVLYEYRENPTSLVHTKSKLGAEIDAKIKRRLLEELTPDKELQDKLIEMVSLHFRKPLSFKEWLFSVRNEWEGCKKYKKLCILGIKIKL